MDKSRIETLPKATVVGNKIVFDKLDPLPGSAHVDDIIQNKDVNGRIYTFAWGVFPVSTLVCRRKWLHSSKWELACLLGA